MTATIKALILGIATFVVVWQAWADDIPVSAIRFKGGEVVELKLRDGKAVSDPIFPIGKKVNWKGLTRLDVELVKIYDPRYPGLVFYCPHTPGVCSIWCKPGPEFAAGNFWVYLNPKGIIEKVELPDGTIISEPFRNLKEQPMLNIELRESYSIGLMGFEAEDGEVMFRVLPK